MYKTTYKRIYHVLLPILVGWFGMSVFAQTAPNLTFKLNEDGSHFVKGNVLTQVWTRYADYNDGTTYNTYAKDHGLDIGIRRYRIQLQGQLTDRAYFYSQFGENNFHASSNRQAGFYVLDAMGEYALVKNKLEVGGGLSSWTGFSRFSAPAVGAIMGVDAPLHLQATNDVNDQFVRKLTIFAKGQIHNWEYRVSLAEPFDIQKSSAANQPALSETASFSPLPAKKQWNGYLSYSFLEHESNKTPYRVGSYLGTKKIFNIGGGIVYQPDAMWRLDEDGGTTFSNLLLAGVDFFYDAPIGEEGAMISAYLNVSHTDFGKNYLRQLGAMNPGTGNDDKTILNGAGNNFPGYGTGNNAYVQVGYKFKKPLFETASLMPYASVLYADYEALNDPVAFYDVGLNFLLPSHVSKFTVAYQNRPIFDTAGDLLHRKGALILQYQVSL